MLRRHRLLLLALPFLGSVRAEPAGSGLRWVGGDLPPFVWQGQNGPQGYAYELALTMAQKLGRKPLVEFFPWARAVKMAQEEADIGIFPLARTPDREDSFRWLIPLTRVHYSLFVQNGPEPLPSMEQLRTQRIVVLRGSPIIKNLQAAGFTQISEGKDYKDMLRRVQLGMATAAYAGAPMLQAAIEEFGFRAADFRVAASLGEAELYMATSLRLPSDEARLWQASYRELVQDGTVARLQRKYQISAQ
ncbi:transporter substrate-binding domain-containing protein [Pelomonas sp. SE-A7]|uniref:substrate-binding periplasmic protein n=1 Tax=Pelomonas sp. SE-A7 TaxID=3054953 RepID=UPI00259CD389|nr:transporter substrate-binding domain-containing protein [Pelomonas sp. SE-A7]MDM4765073.1 transporter substrate-binding domain-containing protein [Pelomonas sp. SE-A7]